jgi:hypothetical protein
MSNHLFNECIDEDTHYSITYDRATVLHDLSQLEILAAEDRAYYLKIACECYEKAYLRVPNLIPSTSNRSVNDITTTNERRAEAKASALCDWAAALGDTFNIAHGDDVKDEITQQMLAKVVKAYEIFPRGAIKKNLIEYHTLVVTQLQQRSRELVLKNLWKEALVALQRGIEHYKSLKDALGRSLDDAERQASTLAINSQLLELVLEAYRLASGQALLQASVRTNATNRRTLFLLTSIRRLYRSKMKPSPSLRHFGQRIRFARCIIEEFSFGRNRCWNRIS